MIYISIKYELIQQWLSIAWNSCYLPKNSHIFRAKMRNKTQIFFLAKNQTHPDLESRFDTIIPVVRVSSSFGQNSESCIKSQNITKSKKKSLEFVYNPAVRLPSIWRIFLNKNCLNCNFARNWYFQNKLLNFNFAQKSFRNQFETHKSLPCSITRVASYEGDKS